MKIMTLYANNSNLMYGGAYKRYMELMKGFLSEGWNVYHISPKGFENIKHIHFHHYGTKQYHIPIPIFIQFMIQAIPKSWSIGRTSNIDAIIIFSFFDALIGISYRLFNKDTKIIYCDRGDTIKGIIINLKNKYNIYFLIYITSLLLNNLEKYVYNRMDLIIFNSNIRRKETNLKMSLDKLQIKTIYNNANPSWVVEKIERAKVESEKIKEKWQGKQIICFIGNLFIEGRDLKTLIESFRLINQDLPNTILLIIGDGPDKQKLKNIIDSNNLSDKAIMEGWKDNPFSYMLAADINLVTALHEGCSNTILESLYCGKVTMGTDIGGISALLKYKNLLFPAKDPEEMSKRILKILKDKEEFSDAIDLVEKRKKKFVFNWNRRMNEVIKNYVEM